MAFVDLVIMINSDHDCACTSMGGSPGKVPSCMAAPISHPSRVNSSILVSIVSCIVQKGISHP